MKPILEAVPNFSEGRNPKALQAIAGAMQKIAGCRLLHTDPGEAANRTVFTLLGDPPAVLEALFEATRTAIQYIDMRHHHGTHPRMGALDVCPLIPLQGIGEEAAIAYSHTLAKRLGDELGIPVYLYEKSTTAPHRRLLADIRKGEYEGLPEKMKQPGWIPDYGPHSFQPQVGASVLGVRSLLLAYNVNLATTDVKIAKTIAAHIRNLRTRPAPPDFPFSLPPAAWAYLKAIGWYIADYDRAQISMNITDIAQIGFAQAFEACSYFARQIGVSVTGSELIGMCPATALASAGRYYGGKELDEETAMNLAVQRLGLADLGIPFTINEKVLRW